MAKYHKYISVVIAALFVVILQKFSFPHPVFRFLVPAFLVFAGAVTVYNRYYLLALKRYNRWALVRPLLLLGSGFGLFWLVHGSVLTGAFLITAFFVVLVFEYFLGNFSENVLLNETLLIAFGAFLTLTAFARQFPRFQTVYIVCAFLSAYLISRAHFDTVPQETVTKNMTAAVIGLFCAELFWVFNFLPFHYSASGLLLFNFYYLVLMLTYFHFYNTLTIKKIQFHLIVFALISAVTLLVTPWNVLQ